MTLTTTKPALRPLRIMMLGLRGIPAVQGGVETHVMHLAQELVGLGCAVEVVARSSYVAAGGTWKGVKVRRIWSPRSKYFEAIIHTFLGVLSAAWRRPDILHIHAIGPSLMVPLARLLGLRVVVTHHGFDYRRQKWNRLGKRMLRLGEAFGMNWANARIAVSHDISATIARKYAVPSHTIHNGIDVPEPLSGHGALDRFSICPQRYVLNVARLVPEKRHLDLIEAFARSELNGWQLVLVGAADHADAYVEEVKAAARRVPNVIMTGALTGSDLVEVYTNAGLFVLPSSHEGLPIVLLEALSYGLPTVASDIPANLEIGLGAKHYFPTANVAALTEKLRSFVDHSMPAAERLRVRDKILADYAWPKIARQTLQCYRTCFPSLPDNRGAAQPSEH